MASLDIYKIADYFIRCPDTGSQDVITHLKLQKLCYYSQAWFLALNDDPLTRSPFQAWPHGPVSPRLFKRFRAQGINPIHASVATRQISDFDFTSHLEEVWRVYGGFSAKTLEKLTHSEDPWLKARGVLGPLDKCNNVITHDSMKLYYRARLQDGKT